MMSESVSGDTVAAISTPIGEGGIGIVRLSGPGSLSVVSSLFHSPRGINIKTAPTHTVHYGHIIANGQKIDEVLVTVMLAPRTYTREDVVEINCHGGIVAVRMVLDAVLDLGVRLAERGEFTKRAFLNGRISLDQAAAVLNIVSAKSKLGLEVAVDQLAGRFSGEIARIRQQIALLLATVEVEIDYPDEDLEQPDILDNVHQLIDKVSNLLKAAEQGRVLREGLTISIIGRPNVGKSTLLNALLSEKRAIVTSIPGTTRDTIEEIAVIGGVPVRLIDTAGIRTPGDPVEVEGVRRSKEAVKRADLVLLVIDRSSELTAEDFALLNSDWDRPIFVLLNKSDLPIVIDKATIKSQVSRYPVCEISAETTTGIEKLRQEIISRLMNGGIEGRNSALLLSAWERNLLIRMNQSLKQASGVIQRGYSPDMVSEELRLAHKISGELQGIDTDEEVLDELFRHFCVGK
jgi:tRNA modification GTPase